MRLLLDTHVVIWLARSPSKLSAAGRDLIVRPTTIVFVSSVTFWELRLKWKVSPASVRADLLDPLEGLPLVTGAGFQPAPLAPADCLASLEVPLDHRDPFDEQLLIHASRLGAKLLTRDRKLVGHPLALGLA